MGVTTTLSSERRGVPVLLSLACTWYRYFKKTESFRFCGGCVVLLTSTSLEMVTEGHLFTRH